MAIEIRSAKPADTEGIRRVAEQAWHSARAPIIGTKTADEFLERYYDAETFRSLIETEESILDVAVDGETDVVGFVGATPSEDAGTFDLGRIYVRPGQWREGIGRRLLAHAERAVERRGGERIRLVVVAENDRAIEFYESAGYRRDEEFYDERIDTSGYTYVKELD